MYKYVCMICRHFKEYSQWEMYLGHWSMGKTSFTSVYSKCEVEGEILFNH